MCRLFFYYSSGICARQFTKVQYMPFFIVEAYKRKTLLKARYKSVFYYIQGIFADYFTKGAAFMPIFITAKAYLRGNFNFTKRCGTHYNYKRSFVHMCAPIN